MEFPERISERITGVIASNIADLTEEKLEQINYGIAILIANSYKFVFIFAAAYFLRVFGYMLLALFSFGLIRTFAAGLHGKKEWTCFISTTSFVFGTIYAAKYISLNAYITTLIYGICLAAVSKYAPADTEERPIFSKSHRKKMKTLGIISVILLYTLSIYYNGSDISDIISLSSLAAITLILPVSYKITKNVYGTGLYTKKEEV